MIIILEGNAGSGKSNLAQPIADYVESLVGADQVVMIPNPMAHMGEDTLPKILSDMQCNESFAVENSKLGKFVVMERTLFSAINVFGDTLIPDNEKDIFSSLRKENTPIICEGGYESYYCLYVYTPIHWCLDRLESKGRNDENLMVSLIKIENQYDDIFLNGPKKVMRVDGTFDKQTPLQARIETHPNETSTLEEFLDEFIIQTIRDQRLHTEKDEEPLPKIEEDEELLSLPSSTLATAANERW